VRPNSALLTDTFSSRRFEQDGIASIPGVASSEDCDRLAGLASAVAGDGPGSRCLLPQGWCSVLAARLRDHPTLSALLGSSRVAVQCTYFAKSAHGNWSVPLHQDRSIPVARRVEHAELRGWSSKEGMLFVQAPAALLERLVAVRVHLDPCGLADGPLHVVPGSHRRGVVSSPTAVGQVPCTGDAGSALAMRPLLLHASPKATGHGLRRVLHFLFGPAELPHGLSWHAVA
jgi:hypothetical protein